MTSYAGLTEEIRRGPSGPEVGALFDLDQTLLAGFSAGAFVRERIETGGMSPRQVARAMGGALGFKMGRTDFSHFVASATAAYRGLDERTLEAIGESVFEKYLAARIYPESRAIVRAHQDRGHTVAVVSSATRFQVEPIARALGIEHVLCTRLEVSGGRFTGRVVPPACYGDGKARAAARFASGHDVALHESWFYTDSHEDLPLLEAVGRPRPLNPSRTLARLARARRWPVRTFRSRGAPSAGDWLRTGLALGSAWPAAAAGAAAGVVRGSWREGVDTAGSIFGELATKLAGIEIRVEGEAHLFSHRPAVFAFTHRSALDALVMLKLLRHDVSGVADTARRRNPLLGPLFAAAGFAFVDRAGGGGADPAALDEALQALRAGRSLAVATSDLDGPAADPPDDAAFRLAMRAGVPLVPVALGHVEDALPAGGWAIRPVPVDAVVLPPIDTTRWTEADLDSAAAAVRAAVRAALADA